MLRGHSNPVINVVFSPDGKLVASAGTLLILGQVGELKVWERTTGKEVLALNTTPVHLHQIAFSPDSKRVAGLAVDDKATKDGQWQAIVRTWDVATGRELFAIKEYSQAGGLVAFRPDGSLITVFDKSVKAWDSLSGRELQSFESRESHRNAGELIISSDGHLLAGSVRGQERVSVWELASGKDILSLNTQGKGSVNTLAFSPDGKRIAVSTADRVIRIWNFREGSRFP